MARANADSGSLRFSRRELAGLIIALLLSLLAHLGVWDGVDFGKKHGWWHKILHATSWLQPKEKKFPAQAKIAKPSEPDIFVDVSHADADAPEQTKYYSNKSSRAANQEVANAEAPKINGTQTEVPKTETVPKPVKAETAEPAEPAKPNQFSKLQPSPSPQHEVPETPETPQTPGETDLLRAKKQTTTSTPSPAASQRPRTLKQALAQRDQIPGQEMRQAGGVPRHAMWSSLDAKATPFGEYDRAIVEAVSQRWYDLLDNHRYAEDRSGKVTLRFKLKSDGTILEMQTTDNNVGEVLGYLCQEAIEEAAPFGKWPPDMVRMIGANYREITFSFYYY